jgi:hypothetical protein
LYAFPSFSEVDLHGNLMIRPACRVSDRLVEPEEHGIVAFIISALHASRRRLASRVIRQCEHLLGNEAQKTSGEQEW